MVTDRSIQEITAQCISTMVFYHNCERSQKADKQMIAEIQAISSTVEELGISTSDIDERIIRRVDVELTARYGHELGARLFGMFIEGFEGRCAVASSPPFTSHAMSVPHAGVLAR